METSTSQQQLTELLAHLPKILSDDVRIKRSVLAGTVTTMGVGGVIDVLLEPTTLRACLELFSTLEMQRIPWRILGAGSNTVISDTGLRDVVIRFPKEFSALGSLSSSAEALAGEKLGELFPASFGHVVPVFAWAGCSLMTLSRRATQEGLSGFEFAAGIPASIGGAVWMNAGAHGESTADVLQEVVVLQRGQFKILQRSEIPFAYRHSGLPPDAVVLGALFHLRGGDVKDVVEKRNRCLQYRRDTQPLTQPSFGSVFRNPSGTSRTPKCQTESGAKAAAELLEACGLKGYACGGASYSAAHANWIVKNDDSATAEDVFSLIAQGKERVREKFHLELHPEVVVW